MKFAHSTAKKRVELKGKDIFQVVASVQKGA